jgi:YidC/Oxa1 family membrane protein insertase
MIGTIWNTLFYSPVLNLLIIFYNILFDNLGLAIIAMAIIFRLLLIPLMKKQTEMTKKMSSLKPQLDELQKKYKNNPEKLSQEQIKLYKKVGYNPLGCLVTFLPQLLILSVLIQVIRGVTAGELDGIYPFVSNWLNNGVSLEINTQFLFWDLTSSYNDLSSEFGRFSTVALPYLGLSLLVGVSQYFMSKFTQIMQGTAPKKEKKKTEGGMSPEDMQKKMMGGMNYMLPLMTVFFSISYPAALSLYWAVQSFTLVAQYMILDREKTKKGVQSLITKLKKKTSKSSSK